MRTNLAHVCIESSDLEGTEAFYRVLGLERRFELKTPPDQQIGRRP